MPSVLQGLASSVAAALKPQAFTPRDPSVVGERYRRAWHIGVQPRLDIYVPHTPAPPEGRPSALVVHGGAFLVGSRRMTSVRYVASALVEAGMAVACVDYRLLFRGGPLSTQRADVAAAREHWRNQAARLHLDPTRVSVVGMSAGGALALLDAAAADPAYHRVVSVYGVYELAPLTGPGSRLWKAALTRSLDEAAWASASPLAVVDRVVAPLMMIHGTEDALVPYAQAERFLAAREQAGLDTLLHTYEGLPHGWLQDASRPETAQVVEQITAFLLAE